MRAWSGASFPLAILISLSLLTLWLRQAVELPPPPSGNKARHAPDTIIQELKAVTLDSAGRPLYRMEAARLVHFPDDDTTEVTDPRVFYTPDQEASVTLAAKHGKILGKGNVVELYEDVDIRRAANATDPGWQAQMPQVTAYPNEARAETRGDFIFRQGAARLTGIGFSYDHHAGTLDLHSQVRGEIPPPSASHSTPADGR
jgi:lipopolysaccharide export system protein LptC